MADFPFNAEKNLVINNKQLIHTGNFKVNEIFSVINKAVESKGYEKNEKRSEELVLPAGRQFFLELRPSKELSNYLFLHLKIKIELKNVTEKVEGDKKFDHGEVIISFDSWSLTDYEDRWGTRPWIYFIKGVINKYLYKFPQEGSAIPTLVSDTAYIYGQVKRLLDSYKGEGSKIVKEEDVMKEMEKDIFSGQEIN